MRGILFTLAAFALAASTVHAQTPQQTPLGTFNDWAAYSADTAGGKTCFVISQPTRRAPEGLRRGDAYFFVTHRTGQNAVKNEISMQVGFPTQANSAAEVSVGNAQFRLFTADERAWSDGRIDGELVQAMRAGVDMSIRTTSGRGNVTTDTYSLRGVSAALDAINQACP